MSSRHLAFLFLASLLSACADSSEPAQSSRQAALGLPNVSSPPPEDVVRHFLGALQSGQESSMLTYLTPQARRGFGGENGVAFDPEDIQGWDLGTSKVEGRNASVPVTLATPEGDRETRILLRTQDGSWRIWGLAFETVPGFEWKIDLEDVESADSHGVTEFGDELQAAFQEGIEAVMNDAVAEWNAGGSEAEILFRRTAFEAIEPTTVEEHEASYVINLGSAPRPAAELFEEALAGTGVTLEAGTFAAALQRTVTPPEAGLSRIRAIEELCTELDLHPVYSGTKDEPGRFWSADDVQDDLPLPNIVLRDGARALPVAFAGPFLIEVEELEEDPPHGTGSITLAFRALGLHPAVIGMQLDGSGGFTIEDATAGVGRSLLVDRDVVWLSSPELASSYQVDRISLDLMSLLRDVDTIAHLTGNLRVVLPTEVQPLRATGEGQLSSADWKVTVDSWGEYASFTARSESEDPLGWTVRTSGLQGDGAPLGVLMSDSNSWNQVLNASLQTPEAPATIDLKLCRFQELTYAFDLRDVPLGRHMEQPLELEPLRFTGPAPLEIAFVAFHAADSDFPEVDLRLRNLANKVAVSASVEFVYLDGAGQELDSFPHSLTGAFTLEGTQPLAAQEAKADLRTTAFFVPDGTESVRVRLDEVRFEDATTWKRTE